MKFRFENLRLACRLRSATQATVLHSYLGHFIYRRIISFFALIEEVQLKMQPHLHNESRPSVFNISALLGLFSIVRGSFPSAAPKDLFCRCLDFLNVVFAVMLE